MSINLSEVILTVVNFIVLMLLLNQFLYKPVVKFMDERMHNQMVSILIFMRLILRDRSLDTITRIEQITDGSIVI